MWGNNKIEVNFKSRKLKKKKNKIQTNTNLIYILYLHPQKESKQLLNKQALTISNPLNMNTSRRSKKQNRIINFKKRGALSRNEINKKK